MAEARSIASVGVEFRRGVQLALTDAGLRVRIDLFVPTKPSALLRIAQRRLRRTANALRRQFYPLGPAAVLGGVALLVAVVLASPENGWLRTGPVATAVWHVATVFPWYSGVGRLGRIAIMAFWAGLVLFLILVFLQRLALRALFSYQGWARLEHGQRPPTALKVWGALVKLLQGRLPMLYGNQAMLPTLPLPSIETTVRKYLQAAAAVCSEEDMREREQLAQQFLSDAKQGRLLQRYLRMKHLLSPNYVSDWWEKYVYLRCRSPLMINSNFYCIDSARAWPTTDQCARAAVLVSNMLDFKDQVESESLEPIYVQGVVPLCMEQYRRTFCTTRLPGRECDTLDHDDSMSARHIVVIHKGVYYALTVIRVDGSRVPAWHIEDQLRYIINDVKQVTIRPPAIAALTAGNRTEWADARESFFSFGVNRLSLELVESAILVLSLDTESPSTWTDQGRLVLHGDGANRWFDKSLNVVVFANGRAGVNGEHSWADALVIAHLWEVACLCGEWRKGVYDANGRAPRETGATMTEAPQRLAWDLDAPAISRIDASLVSARQLIADLQLCVTEFSVFGKGVMKKCSIAPDAFFQLAMQLAYFRDQGRVTHTYESSMTRLFLQGRTETIRSASADAAAFVRAMMDPAQTPQERARLCRVAADRHQVISREAMTGKGVDRHLFALYVVSLGKGIDAPFLRKALGDPWRLSTSQQPQQQTRLWDLRKPEDAKRISPGGGFGPVADDGYGVSYMIASDDQLFYHVSSKRSCAATDSDRFAQAIHQALIDMRATFEAAGVTSAKAK